jgi:phage terminase large subunit-like protein
VALEQDAAGNIKITKSKSKQKVDGAIALAMAIGAAQTEGACSIYEARPSFLMV